MKKLILVTLLLLYPVSAHCAYVHVQTLDAAAASDAGLTQTRSVTWTGGNLGLIYSYGWISGGTPTISSVVSSNGSVWALAIASIAESNRRGYIYYCENLVGGADTVTVTWSGTLGSGRIVAQEWSGNPTSAALDDTTATNGGSSTTPSVTVTPAATNTLYVGFMHHLGADGTGITSTYDQRSEAESFMSVGAQSTVTSGSLALSWTLSAGAFWQCVGATFAPAPDDSGFFMVMD